MIGLGDRLRTLREQRGLSMSGLAREVGVSRSYIWRIEHDQRRLNTRLIQNLARVLDVEPSVLIGGEPREIVKRRQEALVGQLLNARPLNPRFVDGVVDHVLRDLLPDDPEIRTVRDWDARLLDMGSRAVLLTRLTPRAGRIADRLEALDRSMDYAEFRRRMLEGVSRWTRERRARFVSDLLPEILRRPGHYRRMTGEDIFLHEGGEAGRLRRFPCVREGDDPRDALHGRSDHVDLAGRLLGEAMFAFEAPDDSMAPRAPRGSILVANADDAPRDGELAVVRVDGLSTACRLWRREGESVRLIPLDPRFPESVHAAEDVRWAHPVVRVIAE
jgi:transcriptional regulator with XRE-family HTH domain